ASNGKTNPQKIRLPTRQAKEGNRHRIGTSQHNMQRLG
ncbi:MAG: hypothetical protein QG670_198, partial [Thermoproteota archaeon]|nr:hypothetical protein [Thermoproteota archaeon]